MTSHCAFSVTLFASLLPSTLAVTKRDISSNASRTYRIIVVVAFILLVIFISGVWSARRRRAIRENTLRQQTSFSTRPYHETFPPRNYFPGGPPHNSPYAYSNQRFQQPSIHTEYPPAVGQAAYVPPPPPYEKGNDLPLFKEQDTPAYSPPSGPPPPEQAHISAGRS